MKARLIYCILTTVLILGVIVTVPSSTIQAQNPVTVTTRSQSNLRAGPSQSFSSLGRVPANTTLPAEGRDTKTTWIQVNFNGTLGWISVGLLTTNGDLNTLPVITPPPTPTRVPRNMPTIPLFDDFETPSLDFNKWEPVGNNYILNADNGTMYMNISWFTASYVKTGRLMREVAVLFTMEQPNTGNAGIHVVIIGSYTYSLQINHCKEAGSNEVLPGNNWVGGKGIRLRDRDCPSTHLLGIAIQGNRANFYVDKRRIDSMPWTGYIEKIWVGGWADTNFQKNDMSAPDTSHPNFKPTIGRVQAIWIDYVP
jgi:hypothetical protein